MKVLTFLFKDHHYPLVDYVIHCNSQWLDSGESSLAALVEHQFDDSVLVIPGEDVTALRVALPKGASRHRSQAIPYLAEEDLAAPVETLHFAVGPTAPDNTALVLAIDRELMAHYLALVAQQGLTVTAMIPDYLLLPQGGSAVLAQWRGKYLLRLPDGRGMGCNTPPPAALGGHGEWTLAADGCVNLAMVPEDMAVNLCQGEFATRRTGKYSDWQRPLGAAFAAGLCLVLMYFLAVGTYFSIRADRLDGEATALYKSLFPEDRRIVNIRRQMEGHLKRSVPGERDVDFFRLLSALAEGVAAVGPQEIALRNLQFDRHSGSLVAELQATSMTTAQDLRQHIGANAQVLSASKNDAGAIVRIRIDD